MFNPFRLSINRCQIQQSLAKEGVVIEITVELGLALPPRAQKQIASGQLFENEISGIFRSLQVLLILQNAITVDQGRNHQTVPAGENLLVAPWTHSLSPFDHELFFHRL